MTPRRPAGIRAPLVALCLAALAAAGPRTAGAQGANLAGAGEIEYSFSPPGARSLAMGGAFVGRADDATASYANPAGLVQLREPEVSLEVRSATFAASAGLPTPLPDGSVIPAEEADGRATGIQFVAYVYPRKRWTLAVYRYQLADYDVERRDGGTVAELFGDGLAGAYRFDNGLAVGAVLLGYRARLDNVDPCRTLEGPCPGTLIDRADDRDFTANLGALWQVNERWSVGAVYRRGPTFEVIQLLSVPALPEPQQIDRFMLRVPDVAAVGVGFRPTSRLVLNADWVRVFFSQATEVGDPTIVRDSRPLGRITLDDVDEIHLGVEYSFWNLRGAPALRLGAWFDPDHRPRFEPAGDLDPRSGPGGGPSDAQAATDLAQRFPRGEDRVHVSAGFGFVFARRFQLDAAADVSEETETFSVSTLVRF